MNSFALREAGQKSILNRKPVVVGGRKGSGEGTAFRF